MAVKKKKITATPVFASEAVLREKKEEIKEMESLLAGGKADRDVSYRNDKIQDPDLIKNEIRKRQAFIEKHTPQRLKGEAANKAYRRAKELAAEIKEMMPSEKMFNQRYPRSSDNHSRASDFEKAVQQQMEFQKAGTKKVEEYRYLMARLDPANPMVRSIEQLRRAR